MESKEDSELNFYYNRENRIKNAPQSVQDFYSGNMKRIPRNIIKIFTQNKATRLSLLVLIIVVIGTFFVQFMNKTNARIIVKKVKIELTSFTFGDEVLASLSFSELKDYNSSEAIIVEFCAFDRNENLLSKKSDSGLYDGKKTSFGTKFPDFEIYKIVANFEYQGKEYTLEKIR